MHTERGFDRLVNFSDAVVAIAITLLILPLVDTATDLGEYTVAELLVRDGPKLMVFVISFAVIGRFWLNHHRMYELAADYSTPLLWANLLWLLSIVFLPFPTELISSTGNDSITTTALYVGTMVVTSLSGTLQMFILVQNPRLQAESVRGTLRMAPSIMASGLMVLVFVLVLLVPSLGLLWLLVLGLTGPTQAIYKRWFRAKHPELPLAES